MSVWLASLAALLCAHELTHSKILRVHAAPAGIWLELAYQVVDEERGLELLRLADRDRDGACDAREASALALVLHEEALRGLSAELDGWPLALSPAPSRAAALAGPVARRHLAVALRLLTRAPASCGTHHLSLFDPARDGRPVLVEWGDGRPAVLPRGRWEARVARVPCPPR